MEKSLVVARGSDQGDAALQAARARRQYALEKLEESGEAEAARRAHAEYFLGLAEEAEPELFGPRDVEVVRPSRRQTRQPEGWPLLGTRARGEAELALRLAGALWPFWEAHGHHGEGRRWLEEALGKEGHTTAVVRARALNAVGRIAVAQNDTYRAEAAARGGDRPGHRSNGRE